MNDHVVVVSEAACSGLEGLVGKRRAEMEDLQDEVRSLEEELGRRRTETST